MAGELDDYIAALEEAISLAAPMSQRARVLSSLQRFADRANRAIASDPNAPGFRRVSHMLEVRDMARTEQEWVNDQLRVEAFPEEHEDLLLLYKMMLATTESTTMMAVAYITSDKEGSEESTWWANAAAQVMVKTLAIVPMMVALPSDRVGPPEEQ